MYFQRTYDVYWPILHAIFAFYCIALRPIPERTLTYVTLFNRLLAPIWIFTRLFSGGGGPAHETRHRFKNRKLDRAVVRQGAQSLLIYWKRTRPSAGPAEHRDVFGQNMIKFHFSTTTTASTGLLCASICLNCRLTESYPSLLRLPFFSATFTAWS